MTGMSMKVSMEGAKVFFRENLSLANIKQKVALKFGFSIKTKEPVETRIPKEAEPDSTNESKSIKARQAKKTKPSAWVNWKLSRSRKQSQKAFKEMLQHWISDNPEKAIQSYSKLHDQMHKTLVLERVGIPGAIAADDYADKARSILHELTPSLSPDEQHNIRRNLRPGGKIYRGLSALTFLLNGTNSDRVLMRHDLSEKANTCLTHICPLYGNLFKEFHPNQVTEFEQKIFNETNPDRTDQSSQEIEDIKAAFFAMKKIK